MRRALKLTVVLALLAVPSAALAATGGGRVLAINCFREQYKPRKLVISCGDGGLYLAGLHWTSWTRVRAAASGSYVLNDCKPTCAQGHFHSYPVRVTLSRPKSCPGQAHRAFGRATFTYPGRRPSLALHRFTFFCP
jgi:hypothetical protein